MRKIIITTNISLDGVMQAPMGAEEDLSDAFKYGGWTANHADAISGRAVQKEMNQKVDYLFGRKTFDIFAAFWPSHANIWPGINNNIKYVLSKTIKKSDWINTIVLENLNDIKRLKAAEGCDIHVWGSSQLTHLLLENGLVDELHLRIFPLILGNGKKLFHNNAIATSFNLAENTVTTKGVFIAHYIRVNEVTPTITTPNLMDKYLQ